MSNTEKEQQIVYLTFVPNKDAFDIPGSIFACTRAVKIDGGEGKFYDKDQYYCNIECDMRTAELYDLEDDFDELASLLNEGSVECYEIRGAYMDASPEVYYIGKHLFRNVEYYKKVDCLSLKLTIKETTEYFNSTENWLKKPIEILHSGIKVEEEAKEEKNEVTYEEVPSTEYPDDNLYENQEYGWVAFLRPQELEAISSGKFHASSAEVFRFIIEENDTPNSYPEIGGGEVGKVYTGYPSLVGDEKENAATLEMIHDLYEMNLAAVEILPTDEMDECFLPSKNTQCGKNCIVIKNPVIYRILDTVIFD